MTRSSRKPPFRYLTLRVKLVRESSLFEASYEGDSVYGLPH